MGNGVLFRDATGRGQSGAMLEAIISEGCCRTSYSLFIDTVRNPELVTACKNVSCCYSVGLVSFNFWLMRNRPQSSVLGVFSRLISDTISEPDPVCSGLVLCPVGLWNIARVNALHAVEEGNV